MELNATDALANTIAQNQIDQAISIAQKNLEKYQTDETFVLLYLLLQIYCEEQSRGLTDIFSSPVGRTSSQLQAHYTRIKFYLRRFEYNLTEECRQEALTYFLSMKVSAYALFRIGKFAWADFSSGMTILYNYLKQNGQDDYCTVLHTLLP